MEQISLWHSYAVHKNGTDEQDGRQTWPLAFNHQTLISSPLSLSGYCIQKNGTQKHNGHNCIKSQMTHAWVLIVTIQSKTVNTTLYSAEDTEIMTAHIHRYTRVFLWSDTLQNKNDSGQFQLVFSFEVIEDLS